MRRNRRKKGIASSLCIAAQNKKTTEAARKKKIDKAVAQLEALAPKLTYHLKTKKEIKVAIDCICKSVRGFIDVRIVTERKQVKVKISPGRPSLTKSVYKNKWTFSHGIEWELNEKALVEASRSDGIFPLISNTSLDASDILRSYKDQPFLEKRMYTKKTVLEVAPDFSQERKTYRGHALFVLHSLDDRVAHRT
jgi:hypothetical protein